MPKIVDHDKRREELLHGCFDLWAERGYSAVTMREIAKELKVSTGTLYHYFDNKDHLFVQMLSWMGKRDIDRAISMIKHGMDRMAKLNLLISYVMEEAAYFRKLLMISMDYYRLKGDSPDSVLSEVIQQYRDTIVKVVQLPSSSKGTLLLSMFFGMLSQGMMDPNNVSPLDHATFLQQAAPLLFGS